MQTLSSLSRKQTFALYSRAAATTQHLLRSKNFHTATTPLHQQSKQSILAGSHETPKGLDFPGISKSQFVDKINFLDPRGLPPMEIYRLINVDGTQHDTAATIDVDKELAHRMYKEMHTISFLDNLMYEAQRQGRLSFYMVNAGEEASAIGSASAMQRNDILFCQYREAGAILHRGLSLKHFMAQLYANKDDYAHGRSMPVHYMSKPLNIQPISSPLATQIPQAAGAAYALKVLGTKSGKGAFKDPETQDHGACAICYFGDGAASEGDFHAALNMASTLGCPTIFFCRNNGYAISTPTSEQYKGDGIASRGYGYGMYTIRVDGNDLLAVRRVTQQAREIATSQKRPVLIEAMSYRVSHHSTSDDSFAYRPKREVEDWKRRDNPMVRFRRWMENQGWWSDADEQSLKKQVKTEVMKEFAAGEKTQKAKIKYLFEDIYDTLPPTLVEQRKELAEILDTYPDHFDLSSFEGGRAGLEEDK